MELPPSIGLAVSHLRASLERLQRQGMADLCFDDLLILSTLACRAAGAEGDSDLCAELLTATLLYAYVYDQHPRRLSHQQPRGWVYQTDALLQVIDDLLADAAVPRSGGSPLVRSGSAPARD